jgi:Ca-activated chloride channel family protein
MLKKTALLALIVATTLAGCAPKMEAIHPVVEPTKPQGTTTAVAAVAAAPEIQAEELVELAAVTSKRFVLAEKPGEIEVRLHLKAKPRKGARRPSINLGLVVDTSGSMEGAAIEDARAASLALLDALAEGDRLALVVFHSGTEVLVPSTQLTKKSIAEIRAKIGGMKANGTTDLAGGLAAGLAEVTKSFQTGGINRVVLLGDGIPNDPSPLASLAQAAGERRIAITALGLGLDYDETMMSRLALTSGGKYHFIQDSSKVAQFFADEVLRLKEVTGRTTIVTLSPGPGVVVKDVIGLPVQRDGIKSSVMLGDMSEGDERDILVRLSVPGRHAGSVVELMDAEVAFENPVAPGRRLAERSFVSTKATADAGEIEKGRERDVEHAVARLSVADAIVRAVAAARGGNVPLGRSILDAAEKEAKAAAKEFEDKELAEKAKSIGPLRRSLASLSPPPPPQPGWAPPPSAGAPRPAVARKDADATAEPAPAAVVMKSQAEAMSTIQGN